MWPAFWMLGDDIDKVQWPDVRRDRHHGKHRQGAISVHGTIHGPGYSGDKGIGKLYALSGEVKFADDFHIYAVEWEPKKIRFYVDDHLYQTRTPADLPRGEKWVYDHPFFLLLNVAVGVVGREIPTPLPRLSANHAGRLCARLQRLSAKVMQ